MDISEILVNLLREKNLKQADLSRLTGIPTSLISNYIKGIKSPTLTNSIKLAEALGISVDELAGIDTKKSPASAEAETEEEEKLIDDFSLQLQDALIYLGLIGEGQDLTPTQFTILRSVFQIVAAAFGKENDHFEKFVVSFLNDRAG